MKSRLQEAIQDRADQPNKDRDLLYICSVSQVWLFMDRVKEGYARKLAHMWHGPFVVVDKCGDHSMRLKKSRYALPSLDSGACVEAEARTNVSVSTEGMTESERSGSS